MLPGRADIYIFPAAMSVACFLATASYSQSYEPASASPVAHEGQFSIGGQFQYGAATLGLNRLSNSDGSDRWSEQATNRNSESNASFTLDLLRLSGNSLRPLKLNLSASKTNNFGQPKISPRHSADPIRVFDLKDQRKSDYVISADWGGPEDKYTFSYSSSFLTDRSNTENAANINDDMLNFTRTLRTGSWLSSFTASIGKGYREEPGNRELTQKIGASANFKLMQNDAPRFDITARVIQDRTRKLTPGSSDINTKWELRTGTNILGAMSRNAPTTQPSLSIFFSVKGNSPDEEDKDIDPVDFTAGVAGKVHF